jgi:hypothetical protein
MSCFISKASSSKTIAASEPHSPVIDRILMCQSGLWHNTGAACPSFEQALREIIAGRKSSHWMWYIWPSLIGIRTTKFPELMITDFRCAIEYVKHPILGPRLVRVSQAAYSHLHSGPSLLLVSSIPPLPLTTITMRTCPHASFYQRRPPSTHPLWPHGTCEAMTCFYLAAQSAGDTGAGAVFEKSMYAIASSLPSPPPGGMHGPTLQLCHAQLSSVLTAASHVTPTHCVANCHHATDEKSSSLRALPAETVQPVALSEHASAARGQLGATDAKATGAAPLISPSFFPQFVGFDSSRVAQELRRRYPRANIEILLEGTKQRGVRSDRIVIVVDVHGDIVAAPRVG